MSVRVRIPTPLRSYTAGATTVSASGTTVDEVLADLDAQYAGLRFRVVDEQGRLRTHMKVFVNEESIRDLSTGLEGIEEITLMQALSGG